MAKFAITVCVVRSVNVEMEVEAETPDAAKSIAEDRSYALASNEDWYDAITEATSVLVCEEVRS